MASWRSGYAEDCKSLYGGSIPSEASSEQSKASLLVQPKYDGRLKKSLRVGLGRRKRRNPLHHGQGFRVEIRFTARLNHFEVLYLALVADTEGNYDLSLGPSSPRAFGVNLGMLQFAVNDTLVVNLI
jgi:hypothetical protein